MNGFDFIASPTLCNCALRMFEKKWLVCRKLLKHLARLLLTFHIPRDQESYSKKIKKNLISNAKPLGLIQRCETRFDTDYLMFERLLLLRIPLDATRTELKKKIHSKLSENDGKIINRYLNIFTPITEATVMLSGEKYSTGSLVIPVITVLIEELESKCSSTDGTIKQLSANLLESIKASFSDTIKYFFFYKKCLSTNITKSYCFAYILS